MSTQEGIKHEFLSDVRRMVRPNLNNWENRKDFIGASDAPIIMGVSPYMTKYQLWLYLVGFSAPREMNGAMQRGQDMEPFALSAFEMQSDLIMIKDQRRYHHVYPWMRATLDAISLCGRYIVEIKCPKKSDHQLAKEGKVPPQYYPQLQHQLAVTGLPMVYYFSYNGEEGFIVEVLRDDAFIDRMIEEEIEFRECVLNMTPPELCDRDYVEMPADIWEHAAEEYKKTVEEIKMLEQKQKSLKETLISIAGGHNARGGIAQLTRYIVPGRVDYSSIPALKEVDLDQYRKPATEAWRVTFK